MSPIKKQENRWVWIFALAVILLTNLPYAIGFLRSPETFTGFLIGVEDGNSYIAKMLAGANGDWLFRSPYSIMDQRGALLYIPYLLLGKLLGPNAPHATFVLAFHLFRAVSIVALCFATYRFISQLISKVPLRRLGLAVATLGGGLGWLLLLLGRSDWFGSLPLDFYSPEAFGFLAVFGLPHLVLARALLLYLLSLYLDRDESRPWLIPVLWLVLSLVHLIEAGLGLLLIGLHVAVLIVLNSRSKKKTAPNYKYLLLAGASAAPVFAYNAWVFWRDAYLQMWAGQNQILSPNLLHYLIAYGWLLPFVYLAWKHNKPEPKASFHYTWLIALPFLLYIPIGLQRRLAEGTWLLIVVLALRYFDSKPWAATKSQLWLFVLTVPTTLALLLGSWQAASSGLSPVFRSGSEIAIFQILADVAEKNAVVLTAYDTGNALPAWAPVRVVIGHGPETVGLKQLMNRVENFYELSTPDEARLDFLRNNDVDFVLRGPAELALGRWDPSQAAFLQLIDQVGDYQLFRVVP